MNVLTNTLNNIYDGLTDFEQRTDRFIDYLDERVSSIREKYADVKEVYGGVKRDVEEVYHAVDEVCKKLDEVYKKTRRVFTNSINVVDSAIRKARGIFFPGKKTIKTSSQTSGVPRYQQGAQPPVTQHPVIQQPKKQAEPSTSTPRAKPITAYKPSTPKYNSSSPKQSSVSKQAPPHSTSQVPVIPNVIEEQKQHITLDDLVKEFRKKITQYNKNFKVSIDVYDNGRVIKSYAANNDVGKNEYKEQEQTQTGLKQTLQNKETHERTVYETKKSYLEQLLERIDKRYVDYSVRVTKLYNLGYNTREIVKELSSRGYNGIRNYNDVTDMVVVGIRAGLKYNKSRYNNSIATKLGARDQIIHNYLSGKSYNEIKEDLRKNANGMSISDSSILRIMHEYEKKTGRKVVGERNGKRKNNTSKKGSKSKGKTKGNGRK